MCQSFVLSINEESGKNVNRKRMTVANSAADKMDTCNRLIKLEQVLFPTRAVECSNLDDEIYAKFKEGS